MNSEQMSADVVNEREDSRLKVLLQQYQQTSEDRRHYCSLVWQHTVASILTIMAGGAAVLINDISDEVRGSAMMGIAILLWVFFVALWKHDYADKRCREFLDRVDKLWIGEGLVGFKLQRRTHVKGEEAITAYVEPEGLNEVRAIPTLKFAVTKFLVAFVVLGLCYWGDALGAWSLPSGFPQQSPPVA